MPVQLADSVLLVVSAVLLVGAGVLAARLISRWAGWEPAGPIALIAAAPVVPHIPLFFSLSSDDLLPLLGLAILMWRSPAPRITTDRILRWVLLAVAIATLARVASALANGGGVEGTAAMLVQAVARPIVLLGIVGYVAIAAPEGYRQRSVAFAVASVGTFEAAFGLLAFVIRLPGDAGLQAARPLTSLYNVCPGLISGTLGLSANHLGAVFVISLPFTLGLAATHAGWRRWVWALAAAVQAAALVLTFTRASIVLGVALATVFLVYQRRFVMLTAVTVVATVLVSSAISLGCTTGAAGVGSPGSVVGDRFADGNDRLSLWYSAGRIILDYPLFGIGLQQMNDVVNANPQRYRDTPFGPATSSAHNTILLAGAETGVFGGLAVLGINIGLGVLAIRCAWRWRKRDAAILLAAALAMGGYLAQGMVNNLFSVPATSSLFALALGAFAASYHAAKSSQAGPPPAGLFPSDPYTSAPLEDNSPGEDH